MKLNSTIEFPSEIELLIHSIPSQGNVGQLATDILLSNISSSNLLHLVGNVENLHLLPISGYEQFPNMGKTLCSALEGNILNPLIIFLLHFKYKISIVYMIANTKIMIFHQRSPCIQGHFDLFVEEYFKFLNELNVKRILLLCGASNQNLFDFDYNG